MLRLSDISNKPVNIMNNKILEEYNELNNIYKCIHNRLPLYNIDLNKLSDIFHKYYYDISVCNIIFDLCNFIFRCDNTAYMKKYWLRKIDVIEFEKSKQIILRSGMDNIDSLFVVKAKPKWEGEIIHEALVGIKYINKLRQYIPNFAYIFGYFTCEEYDKELCNGKNVIAYVVYENIPGQTLYDAIVDGLNGDDFLNIYLQILLSLDLAYRNYKFTHYDLHTDNVVLRKFDDYIYVIYPYNNGYVLVKTKYIPVIIDYANSYIDERYIFRENNKPYPLHDSHKIFMNSIVYSDKLKNDKKIRTLYSFFSNEDIDTYTELSLEARNGITSNEILINITHQEVIDYMISRNLCTLKYTSSTLPRLNISDMFTGYYNPVVKLLMIYVRMKNEKKRLEEEVNKVKDKKELSKVISKIDNIINKMEL